MAKTFANLQCTPRLAAILALAAATVACGHVRQVDRVSRVAVLPLDGYGIDSGQVAQMRKAIVGRVSQSLATVSTKRVDRHFGDACSDGSEVRESDIGCAASVGRSVGASHVVFGAVGGLGTTRVLRLHLVSVKRRTMVRIVEEAVFGEERGQRAAAAALASRLLGIQKRPWYTRWWVWAITAGVTAAAIVVPLAVQNDDPYRDLQLP